MLVTCWRHFGWNHWSAKSIKNCSGSHLQPLLTACTCILIIRCSCFCCCCCLNYSLPCRELLSLQALTAGLSAEASRSYILYILTEVIQLEVIQLEVIQLSQSATKLTTWLYTELSKSYIKLRRKTKIVLQNRWRVG